MAVTLNTDLKPRPGENGLDPADRRHIEATGDTYEEACDSLRAQVPDGWLMIGISRW